MIFITQVIINDDFWSFVLRMCCARTVTHTDTHYVAEVLGKWYFFKGCTLCVYVSSNKKNEHKSLSTFFQRRKTRGRSSIGERQMRNIRAYTNTHTHTPIYVEICNTWVALKRDQIKDCLLFYEWLTRNNLWTRAILFVYYRNVVLVWLTNLKLVFIIN